MKKWAVVSVYIDMPKMENTISLHQKKELIPISVQNILEGILKDKVTYIGFQGACEPCVLCSIRNEGELERLPFLLNQVCQDCEKILELSVTIGIGEAYEDVKALGESYIESKEALGYRAIMGNGIPIFFKDMEQTHVQELRFDEQNEGDLIAAIKFGSREEIVAVVERLKLKMEKSRVHINQRQIFLMSAMNCIMQLIQRYDMDIYEVWGKNTDYLKVISRLTIGGNMKNFLINTCLAINENINKKRSTTIINTITEARNYIMEYYTNSELSIETICEHLHLSAAYFSTIFKRETGQSCSNYITELRLNKAMKLLTKTNDKTYVIASKVGYTDSNYFSYVFKKQFGVSPSKYRGK